jgi:hypothetical protein
MNFASKATVVKDVSRAKHTIFLAYGFRQKNKTRFFALARKQNVIRSIVLALQLASCVVIAVPVKVVSTVLENQRMVWMSRRRANRSLRNSWLPWICLKGCNSNPSSTDVSAFE